MLIYMAMNKINGKLYVGQTTGKLDRRIAGHVCDASARKSNTYFHNAIRKYGADNFNWEILHDGIVDIEFLNELEVFYVGYYNTFESGYNLTEGGGGNIGWRASAATKRKMSDSHKGKKCYWYGKELPIEMREKISVTLKSQNNKTIHTKEAKKKMSERQLGEKNHAAVAVIINNKYFETLREAAKHCNVYGSTIKRRIERQVPGYTYA